MSVVISIDPGLDYCAAAIFRPAQTALPRSIRDPQGLLHAAASLERIDGVKTAAAEPMPERLWKIYRWMKGLLGSDIPSVVYVEQPARAGAYFRNQAQQRSKADPTAAGQEKLAMARSALLIACREMGVRVVEVRAGGESKEYRRELLNNWLRQVGKPEIKNLDQSDAAWLGIQKLTEAA